MTTGIFNERVLTLIESLAKAIKEEVDLVKENKTNNPDSDHKGSVPRALINVAQHHLQTNSRIRATGGKLGDSNCPSKCNWPFADMAHVCWTCECGANCN